ncbi:ZIP family metal transporter [Metallumcola ferriviriculae]|uniref:ZIP family metal transporter n=1 Tax=Metallumcola ferriviriculae TaxID=3039180 RepID=A0AAU0UMK5_9FIRM|nr:ZIP family metal transporter [Desulfitibacteraceae bacterium MK1]
MIEYLTQFDNIILLGLLASLAAGLATGVGSIPIFFTKDIPKGLMDVLLGFAAGIMLAATSFSLIIPAIEAAGGGVKAAAIVLGGILLGGIFLDKVDAYFPDTNLLKGPGQNHDNMRRALMFTLAITVHNFPEGLAVGVGFGNGDIANGISLAVAIGLQNMPEGLAVALPLLREGLSSRKAFSIALATGLVEPIGGLLGVGLVQIANPILPWALAFAAGAMLFVISHEIIPETQKNSSSKAATHSLLLGFVIMMFLDNVLG